MGRAARSILLREGMEYELARFLLERGMFRTQDLIRLGLGRLQRHRLVSRLQAVGLARRVRLGLYLVDVGAVARIVAAEARRVEGDLAPGALAVEALARFIRRSVLDTAG